MQIDDALLNKLEKLSALQISDEKREEIKKQLSEIVSFVDVLSELDLSGEEAVVSSIKGGTPLREDEPRLSDVVDTILKHAPLREGHFFAVPKIIE
ncbi:Asp-tRNA(Asn)/Glu-tRNA(Gln) amidotransferase subunit GatC [Campylobacter sp.]|uniref:Asp-tRNA(Asn)/Glu-tRNA(Gln) amidotransferase subunit GatC n=1 Tax=Campylobacter sp. TaxID=205 RepID=UPI003F9F1436